MNLTTIERRVAAVASQLAPPPQPMTSPEMAERLGIALDGW